MVPPDTVLRWHRDLLARRHAARSAAEAARADHWPVRSVRMLVLPLAQGGSTAEFLGRVQLRVPRVAADRQRLLVAEFLDAESLLLTAS